MIDDYSRQPERPPHKLNSFQGRNIIQPAAPRSFESTPPASPEQNSAPVQPSSSPEPAFRTPEQVANDVQEHKSQGFLPSLQNHLEIGATVEAMEGKPAKKRSGKLHLPNWSRKQWIVAGIIAAIVVFGTTVATVLAFSSTTTTPVPAPTPKKAVVIPTPKPVLSPLTGLPVTAEQRDLSVIGVMIENSPDARPQSGLDQAGIVFEAIAEAGITRFLALFQESTPAVIGPVRSSRPYYLDWAMAFDASYAHVGGSPDALQRIKDIGVKDLDQFFNSGAYHRVSNRFAPHNMYTSIDSLRGLTNTKGYTKSTFTPWVRKAKEEPSKNPTARTIDFSISGQTYSVHYDYDPASNSYKRSEGGAAHLDNETKAQLSPKVVIALAMPYSLMPDGYHSDYQTTGSGNMLLFQDGIVTPGTWSKAGPSDQFVFKDGQGKDMQLNPGQTWVTVVDDITKATYHP